MVGLPGPRLFRYTRRVWRAPIVLATVLPPVDDPAMATILEGLCRATGATGCRLHVQLLPVGASAEYSAGRPCGGRSLAIHLDGTQAFRARCELCGAGSGPAASPAAVEALRPLLEGALLALIERSNSGHQLEVVADILGASDEATLLVDGSGELVYANPRGDELLSLHTQQPMARIADGHDAAPLLHLINAEIEALRSSDSRSRRLPVLLADGSTWDLEVVALSGKGSAPYTLVLLAPFRVPSADELRRRFAAWKVSDRESQVLAHILKGKKACQVAEALGISEYTVKDHVKHAYAKLGINSRSQLLSRVAAR